MRAQWILFLVFTASVAAEFKHSQELDPGFILNWRYNEENITMQIVAPTTGWIGIGFSQTSSMIGADLIIMGTGHRGSYVLDTHAEANWAPDVDEVQNVELLSIAENGTHTTATIRRQRYTCDKDDMSIEEGTYRVIWAYGTYDLIAQRPNIYYDYHGRNRGAKSLKLINPVESENKTGATFEEERYFDLRASDFKVPPRDTYYMCKMFKIPDSETKQHIIGFDAYIEEANRKNVHHMSVHICDGEFGPEMLNKYQACYEDLDIFKVGCLSVLGGWAVGMTEFRFPDHTGFPVGGPDHRKFLLLETHYDNPEQIEFEDSSGIRLYFSAELREQEVGTLTIAHSLHSIWVPPEAEKFRVEGHCSETCIAKGMQMSKLDELTVFGTLLHSHLAGRSMKLHHYRDGKEMKPIARDDHYDFNYQEMQYVEDGKVKLKKGDSLMIQCDYGTLGKKNLTIGGLATSNEMCLAFLYYYPAMKAEICDSSPKLLSDPLAMQRFSSTLNFTVTQQQGAEMTATLMKGDTSKAMNVLLSILNQLEWTDEKKKLAETFMNSLNKNPICLDSGTLLMNYLDDFPVAQYEEYVEEDRCNKRKEEGSGRQNATMPPPLLV